MGFKNFLKFQLGKKFLVNFLPQLKTLLFLSPLLVSVLAHNSAYGMNRCVQFPQADSNKPKVEPTIEVCTTDDQYSFRILDNYKIFSREDFEFRIRSAVNNWLEGHHQSPNIVVNAQVFVWLSVPEANPEAAQPRALVDTSKGYLSFWFDLDSNQWVFSDSETAILGSKKYPDSFGYRPQYVLAKGQSNANTIDVTQALQDVGAYDISDQGNGWFTAKTKIFEEQSLASKALKNHGNVLRSVQVNSVVEWIADRQLVFSFPL